MAGVINKIRSKTGLMLIILGATMVLFLAQDLLTSLGGLFGIGGNRDRDMVGNVYGEKIGIEYLNFRAELEANMMNTLQPNQPKRSAEDYMGQAWEQMLRDIVIGHEMQELGIFDADEDRWQDKSEQSALVTKLTGRQYAELFYGQDAHPMIVNNFQSGAQFKQLMNRQLNPQNPDDQRVQEAQNFGYALRLYVERQHIDNAYTSLLKMGGLVTKEQARRDYVQSNTLYDVDYMTVNYSALADSLFKVSDSELQEYYNSHMADYEQLRTEGILQYIAFSTQPTTRDSVEMRKYLNGLKENWGKNNVGDSAYAAMNNTRSRARFANTWTNSKNEQLIDAASLELIKDAKNGDIVGPVVVNGQYRIMKLVDRRTDKTYYKVRGLMVSIQDTTAAGKAKAKEKAEALRKEATKENWEQLMFDPTKNNDPNVQQNRGELGWTEPGLFKDLDAALAGSSVDAIVGPVLINNTYFVLQVQDVNNSAVNVATIAADIEPSQRTLDSLKRVADEFIGKAMRSGKSFEEAAKEQKLEVRTSNQLFSGQTYVSGDISGNYAREAIRWALSDAKEVGEVRGEVMLTESAYIILSLKSRYEEGHRTLEEVKDQVRTKVLADKKAAAIMKRLAKLPADTSMTRLAQAFGPGAFAATASNISFKSPGLQGANDPVLIGNICRLKQGETSKPIKGETGVYVVRAAKVTKPDVISKETLDNHRQQLQTRSMQDYPRQAIEGLKDAAKVKDYRYRF